MKVTIQVFAALKDYFDKEFSLLVSPEASVYELIEELKILQPLAQPVLSKCRIAVNENFVSPEYILNDEERICIIPPSSGG
jgi:sulfur-carrier protein